MVTRALPFDELAAMFADKEFEGLLVAGVHEPDPLAWVYGLRDLYPQSTLPIAILHSPEELSRASIALAGKRFRRSAGLETKTGQRLARRILIDQPSRQVVIDRKAVTFSPQEFRLLLFLIRHAGVVFSRQELLHRTQSGEAMPSPRLIDVLVSRLRAKLDAGKPAPSRFTSVRGLGYRFAPGPDSFVDGWTGSPFVFWPAQDER